MKASLLSTTALITMLFTASHAFSYYGVLERVDMEGVSVLEEDDVADIYQKFMDREINQKDLEEIRNLTSTVYTKKGFPFVKVETSMGEDGSSVTVKVVEGYLKEIYWKGSDDPDYVINQFIEHFKNKPVFNLAEFQGYLLRINDMNTRKVSAVLDKYTDEDGYAVEGAFTVTLLEDIEKKGTLNITIDNNAAKQLERNEITTSLRLNDAMTKNEKLALTYTKALGNDIVNAVSGSYEKLLNVHGTKVNYSFNAGTQYPIGLLSDLDFVNKTNSHSIGISHPFIHTPTNELNVFADFTMKDVKTDMLSSSLYEDNIRTVSLGVSGEFADRFNGRNSYSAEMVQGLDILDSSETSGNANASNSNAKQLFNKVKMQYSRNQFLPYNFSYFGRIKAQMTGSSLLLSEKFTVGGIDCGRGYNPSEFSGDQGACSVSELRYTYKTPIDDLILQPFVHYDYGKVHDVLRTSGVKSDANASSVGGGSKFSLPMNFSGMVVSSKAVNKKISASRKVKRPKVMFMLGYDYNF